MKRSYVALFTLSIILSCISCDENNEEAYYPYDEIAGVYRDVFLQIDTSTYQTASFEIFQTNKNSFIIKVTDQAFTEEIEFIVTPVNVVRSYITNYTGKVSITSAGYEELAGASSLVDCWFEGEYSGVNFNLYFIRNDTNYYLDGKK